MLKNGRNYRAVFEIGTVKDRIFTKEKTIEIKMPFTVNFDINVGTYGSPNIGVFEFYNLNKQDQKDLWLDMFNAGVKYINMSFYAGYGDEMPLVFMGKAIQGNSYRPSGGLETITTIQVTGGMYIDKFGYSNSTFLKGTKYANAIEALINDIPDMKLGYLSDDLPELARNQTFLGQTLDLLKRELSGFRIYQDLDEIHVLKDTDVIPGEIIAITEKSGMLGTPRMSNQVLEVDMVFEPGLRTSQLIYLSSEYCLIKKQIYKIVAIHHRGIISPSISGHLITTCTLFNGTIGTKWNEIKEKGLKQEEKKVEDAGSWVRPVQGQITSDFGWRYHPIDKKNKFHSGIDIGCQANSQVVAVAAGRIINTRWYNGYGNYIEIDHGVYNGNKITSAYGHLNSFKVSPNDYVQKGQLIALSGNTGKTTGPHLHLEIKVNGNPVNPRNYIKGL